MILMDAQRVSKWRWVLRTPTDLHGTRDIKSANARYLDKSATRISELGLLELRLSMGDSEATNMRPEVLRGYRQVGRLNYTS